jgi:hypothetical protein
MFARFGPKDGQFLETDYSRFDQTIRQELLDIEYQLYTSFYDDPEFAVLLKQQQRTFGSLAFGIPYKRLGGRCSGDANTSIGNCLINYFVAWVAHQRLGHKFEGFVEGDDGIIRDKPGLAAELEKVASQLGLRLKCVVTDNPKFCGRYHTSTWNSTSELSRLIPKIPVSFNVQLDELALAKAKLLSLRSLEPNHPVLGPWLDQMLAKLEHITPAKVNTRWSVPSYAASYDVTIGDLAMQGYSPAFLLWARDYFSHLAISQVHSDLEWPNTRPYKDGLGVSLYWQ